MQSDKKKENDKNFYVDHLIRGYYSANFNYDRSVMTIAGGALTVFVVFIDKIVGDVGSACWFSVMKIAWILFALSLALIMLRHYCGIEAHKKALEQLDKGKQKKNEPTGGIWNKISECCLPFSYILVITGLVLAAIFIYKNI